MDAISQNWWIRWRTLRNAGLNDVVALDSADNIARALPRFGRDLFLGQAALPKLMGVQRASRHGRSKSPVQLLEQATPKG